MSLDKLFQKLSRIVYPISGLISFCLAILTHILGLLLYQDYDILDMAVSELSNGSLGWIYRAGLAIAAVFAIPFIYYLEQSVENNRKTNFIKKGFLTMGLIYSISIVFVSVFWKENVFAIISHAVFALTAWVSGFFLILFFSILIIFDSKYHWSLSLFGFITSGAFLIHLLLLNPISQWLMTLGIIFWVWILATYTLYKGI